MFVAELESAGQFLVSGASDHLWEKKLFSKHVLVECSASLKEHVLDVQI